MINLDGGCTCGALRYTLSLESRDDARTTLCHCSSCKRAFGGAFGLTAKVPKESFKVVKGEPKIFEQENGVRREFCSNCGVFICEYGKEAEPKLRYIVVGSLDDGPDALPPKGEFFCSQRNKFMPQIPDTFQKQEIKE